MKNKYLTRLIEQLTKLWRIVRRYQVIIFIVFLALIYGFLIIRINSMSSQQPTDADLSAQLKGTQSPHIDQTVVDKIQQLQDNSVQVKTLFNQARKNPFSE